jgi:hypothetical protein
MSVSSYRSLAGSKSRSATVPRICHSFRSSTLSSETTRFLHRTKRSEGDFRKERRAGPKLAIGCVEPRTSYKTSLPGPSPKAVMAG